MAKLIAAFQAMVAARAALTIDALYRAHEINRLDPPPPAA